MTTDLKELVDVLGIPEAELRAAAAEELQRRQSAKGLLEQPWLFQRDMLCLPSKKGLLRPFHKRGLEWLYQGNKRLKLVLWPRGHLKSTIYTQGETVRHCLLNPNKRVFIESSTEPLAKTFLSAIKGHFADKRIVDAFGNLVPDSKAGKLFKNNDMELTLLSRTDHNLKEPTISVAGLETKTTSQHYDLIFCDDLVCRENVGTFEAMDKVWLKWQGLLDLLEPDGLMVVIGTRWHPLDLYGRILSDYVDPRCFREHESQETEHVDNCKCHFDVSVLTLRDEKGDYIFDSKFDDAQAKLLLEVKGQREFSAQYENNPLSEANLWFDPEYIRRSLIPASEINKLRSSLVWYMMVDPAESEERRSSYTSIVCCGVDHRTGVIYVDYAKQLRVNTEGFIDAVFRAHELCSPHFFGMEKKTRKALEYVLKDKMAQHKRFFTIADLEPMLGNTPNAKEVRIKGLQPLFEHGRIFINEELVDLVKIMQTIPSCTTYDLPDALSYVLQMIPKGLGAGNTAPDNRPVKVLQNKGITYAVSRKPRRNALRREHGTQRAHGLGCFYTPVRPRLAAKGETAEAVQEPPRGLVEIHGSVDPGHDGQLQKVPVNR